MTTQTETWGHHASLYGTATLYTEQEAAIMPIAAQGLGVGRTKQNYAIFVLLELNRTTSNPQTCERVLPCSVLDVGLTERLHLGENDSF